MATLPRRFGPYLLLQRLARGGMGEIFLAQKAGPQSPYVALKTLRPDLTRDDEYVTRFLDEARVAIVLSHPVINKVFDVGFTEGAYFLELEYISGRDVRGLLERARDLERGIPPEIGYYLIGELLSALAYLHEAKDLSGASLKLIHRDVSPQNLMVSWEGRSTIIDFGLARFAARSTATEPGMVLGKLRYMAPEQARGIDIDHRVDIFAAGVMLYEVLSGRRLYEDIDPNTLWSIVARGRALEGVRLELLPESMVPVVQRALAVDPDERFPDAGAFLQAIRNQALWSVEQARAALAELLADLFEVDLRLEQEFMDELGRVAPFELTSDESTHSVSLADPSLGLVPPPEGGGVVIVREENAQVPAQVPAQDAASEDTDSGFAAGPIATQQTPFAEVPNTAPAPEAVPVAPTRPAMSPVEPRAQGGSSMHGESTFIVARSDEHALPESGAAAAAEGPRSSSPGPVPRPVSPPAAVVHAPARGTRVPRGKVSLIALAGTVLLALFVLGAVLVASSGEDPDPRLARNDPPAERPASAVEPVADSADPADPADPAVPAVPGDNTAAGSGVPVAADLGSKRPPAGQGEGPSTALSGQHDSSRRDRAKRRQANRRQASQRSKNRRAETARKRPDPGERKLVAPPPLPQVESKPEPEPAPKPMAVATPKPPPERPRVKRRGLSSAAKGMIDDVNSTLAAKGLVREDARNLWPDFAELRKPGIDDQRRRAKANEFKKRINGYRFSKSFIRAKLNRVQGRYAAVRPRLEESSTLFKDLEKARYEALKAFTHAGNDADRLARVNTLLNAFALGVQLASH